MIGMNHNEGESVTIRGCRIISHFNLTTSNGYWLKNGVEKVVMENAQLNAGERRNEYILGNLTFEKSSYINQGYYQCAVFSTPYMKEPLLSKKIHIQFTGICSSYFLITLNPQNYLGFWAIQRTW